MTKKNTAEPITILLVDDHEETRAAVQDWLELEGYKVLAAPDKRKGVAMGLKNPFDVLICDLQLTDGDGWDLMIRLRNSKPVVGIAISGHCAPSDRARSQAAGFLRHLAKPTMTEEMETALAAARRELKRLGQRKTPAKA